MSRPVRDPQGKRALFDPAPGDASERLVRPTAQVGARGRGSLFSAGERRPGTLVLECRSCGARSRVGYVDFLRLHLPFWLWVPGAPFSRLMRCPACDEITWLRARWLS